MNLLLALLAWVMVGMLAVLCIALGAHPDNAGLTLAAGLVMGVVAQTMAR